jgi:hypothetical protein
VVFPASGRWRYGTRLGRRAIGLGSVTVRPRPQRVYRFDQPAGIARVGRALYVADTRGNRVFRLDLSSRRLSPFAGTGRAGQTGDGGPALRARLDFPRDVALAPDGDVYVATGRRVRRVDIATRRISTVISATGYVLAIAVDPASGDLFLSETDDPDSGIRDANRIRRVDAGTGAVVHLAGAGPAGFSGDGGPATSARIYAVHGLLPAPDGALLLGDSFNHRVRRVDLRTGLIDTVAGTGQGGYGGDGGPARSAQLQNPGPLLRTTAGEVIVTDFFNNRIRRISPDGTISTVAGNGDQFPGPDGGTGPQTAIGGPGGIALDEDGDLLFAAMFSPVIRRLDAQTGRVSTVGPR